MQPVATAADRASRLLFFVLAGEHLAVDIRWLRGIVSVDDCTLVPSAPSQLLGLANLRGSALPILDAGPALGAPGRPVGGRMLVLVVVAGDAEVGLAIDAIHGLEEAGSIVPFAEGTSGPQLELGLGLVRRRDGAVALLLNAAKLLHTLRISARWAL
jgi:purine-binding chemotaxis protein CheW